MSISGKQQLDAPTQRSVSQIASDASSKIRFEQLVKRYHYQLLIGCKDTTCTHKLCASCKNGPKITRDACLVMAVQLASQSSNRLFCPRIINEAVLTAMSAPGSPIMSRKNKLITHFTKNPFDQLKTSASQELIASRESLSESSKKSYLAVPLNALGETLSDLMRSLNLFSKSKSMESMSVDLTSSQLSLNDPTLDVGDCSLSLENLSALIASDSSTLTSILDVVFSSSRCLNRSFLDSSCGHASGMDILSIRRSYDLILSLPSCLSLLPLVKAIELLVAKTARNLIKLHRTLPDNLRFLLVLLENPLLEDRGQYDNMIKNLLLVVGNLHGLAKQTLIHWLSTYDKDGYIRILRIVQSFIVQHYHPLNRQDEAQLAALSFYRILFEANTKSNTKLASASDFYLDSLADKISFKDEYKLWDQMTANPHSRSKSVSQPIESGFSYFEYPFLLDPISKTRILHLDSVVQMSIEFEDAFMHQALVIHTQRFLDDSFAANTMEKGLKRAANPFLVLEVNRLKLVEDVMNQLRMKESDLKKPLRIKFVGGGEEGQDQGGVQKEFFHVVVGEIIDPAFGLFLYDEETRYSWINGASLEHQLQFEIIGMIFALALYNGVILGVSFPKLMYKKLLDERVEFEDLKLAFPSLGKGLQQLLDWDEGDVGDVFMRTFEISYDVYGKTLNYPLIENGAEMLVTNANRIDYVAKYTNHLANTFVSKQFSAFKRGFTKVVGGKALHLCNAHELELLICGSPSTDLDFTALENATEYDDGYSGTHHVIEWFWSIVHAFTFEQKQSLLMFVTASDRIPLKGLGQLVFVVQRNGPDSDRLPTALTCFGRLLLPEYATLPKLKNRLLTAIENARGFGLV